MADATEYMERLRKLCNGYMAMELAHEATCKSDADSCRRDGERIQEALTAIAQCGHAAVEAAKAEVASSN